MVEREHVVGNRLMLVGAVLYLLEWVAIIAAGETGPSGLGGTPVADVVGLYRDNARGAGFVAGWCAVALAGRILLVLGARQAMRAVRHEALLDWAVAIMAVSVAVELVELGLIAGTSHASSAVTVDDNLVVALDAIAALLFRLVIASFGLAVAVTSVVMHMSRRIPGWINWLGILGGALMMLSGLLLASSGGQDNVQHSVGMGLQVGIVLSWVWMLAGGIYLWRRADLAPPGGSPS